jgi:predicted nucleic acid-binding protein
VWDTSALLNIKEFDDRGYSPSASLFKDLQSDPPPGRLRNIFPAHGYFELQASVSRKLRDGKKILREFWILGDTEELYPIDEQLIRDCAPRCSEAGFSDLRGGDLLVALIAARENAILVTLDRDFQAVASLIEVWDLNDSREEPRYREALYGERRNQTG